MAELICPKCQNKMAQTSGDIRNKEVWCQRCMKMWQLVSEEEWKREMEAAAEEEEKKEKRPLLRLWGV